MKQKVIYEAPMVETIDMDCASVLCGSDANFGTEQFTDGNWEW